MLIAGATDAEAGAVSFRYRDGTQRNGVPVEPTPCSEIVDWVRARHNADPTAEVPDDVSGPGGVPGRRRQRRRRADDGLRAALDAAPDGLHQQGEDKPDRTPRRASSARSAARRAAPTRTA